MIKQRAQYQLLYLYNTNMIENENKGNFIKSADIGNHLICFFFNPKDLRHFIFFTYHVNNLIVFSNNYVR